MLLGCNSTTRECTIHCFHVIQHIWTMVSTYCAIAPWSYVGLSFIAVLLVGYGTQDSAFSHKPYWVSPHLIYSSQQQPVIKPYPANFSIWPWSDKLHYYCFVPHVLEICSVFAVTWQKTKEFAVTLATLESQFILGHEQMLIFNIRTFFNFQFWMFVNFVNTHTVGI